MVDNTKIRTNFIHSQNNILFCNYYKIKICECKTNKGKRCTRTAKDEGLCWQHSKVCKNGKIRPVKSTKNSITFKVPDEFGDTNIYVDLRKGQKDYNKRKRQKNKFII